MSAPSRVWNRILSHIHDQIFEMAREHSEQAMRFADKKGCFASEASVYRRLKAHKLITTSQALNSP